MTKEGWFTREVKKSSENPENEQKLTNDLYNAAIHAQADILGVNAKEQTILFMQQRMKLHDR